MLKLYSKLADWVPLLTAPQEYADEAAYYWRLITRHARRPVRTTLELGCGGGNNASYLKRWTRMTLTDVSRDMLRVSRKLNPECEHFAGDMRTLRLGREFDAVFVHDAVMYLRTEKDLRRAMDTAWRHCAPGGVALFLPDCTRESWSPSTSHGGYDSDGRSLRYLEWTHDPRPADSEYAVDMVYLLTQRGRPPRIEHERHRFGLFARGTWSRLLQECGFRVSTEFCTFPGGERSEAFIGVRPTSMS